MAALTRLSGGLAGWTVAVQGASLRAGGGGSAIGVEAQSPAPPVDHREVVEQAQRQQVPQGGRAAAGARDDVVSGSRLVVPLTSLMWPGAGVLDRGGGVAR